MAIQQDGQIVVGGIASDSHDTPEVMVARLNGGDGALDKTFDRDGWLAVQLGLGAGKARA